MAYDVIVPGYDIRVDDVTEPFQCDLSGYEAEKGLVFVAIALTAEEDADAPRFSVSFAQPLPGVQSTWNATAGYTRWVPPPWGGAACKSNAVSGAPVHCLIGFGGENRLTFAASDAVNPLEFHAGVEFTQGRFQFKVSFFAGPAAKVRAYRVTLRLDARPLPFAECLRQVARWWESDDGCRPLAAPEHARLPLYSTWYAFREGVTADAVIRQCERAKALGFGTVILDEGWQNPGTETDAWYRGCGDWVPVAGKFPDMGALADAVHGIGMKLMLWFCVPFVARHTKAWDRFGDRFLHPESGDTNVLDPRYPEVREYIAATFERAVGDWRLDGLKLDFIDNFRIDPEYENPNGFRRDVASLEEAVVKLLGDALRRLQAARPDVLIEFRQRYNGPAMRRFANMFRATDCPNDSLSNRIRTIDMRLLCGGSAAHSDPIVWDAAEPVETAALHLINTLFSVPQVSVDLEALPPEHLEMLRYYLQFWCGCRDVLLDGELTPLHPEANYSAVLAIRKDKAVAAVYSSPCVRLPEAVRKAVLVNGSYEGRLYLESEGLRGACWSIRDCRGRPVESGRADPDSAVQPFSVPPAGFVFLNMD